MNKKIISAVAAFWLMSTNLSAGNIDNFLNDAVVQATGPRSLNTDKGTLLSGGSLQFRARTVDVHPLSVSAPSIKAGCGGISATLGSLSFLNMDQIVSLLQGMMANAPGVMFEMALKVICPSCMDTLNALEQLSNQINGMNLNSCNIDKMGADWMESELKGSVLDGSDTDYHSAVQEFNSGAKSFAQDIKGLAKTLTSDGCDPSDTSCGAKFFLDTNLSNSSYLAYIIGVDSADTYLTGNYINALRYFTGDLIAHRGTTKNGTLDYIDGFYATKFDPESYKDLDEDTKDIFASLIGDLSFTSVVPAIDNMGISTTFTSSDTLEPQFEAKIENIIQAVQSRSAINSADINFLSMFKLPVYLIVNKLASVPDGDIVLENVKPELARMLAYEILYEWLMRASKALSGQKKKLTTDVLKSIPFDCGKLGWGVILPQDLDEMIRGARTAAKSAYFLATQADEELIRKIGNNSNIISKINEMRNFTLQRADPRIFESLTFSKALAK